MRYGSRSVATLKAPVSSRERSGAPSRLVDQAVDEAHVGAVGTALFDEDRWRIARQKHRDGHARARAVRRERAARVARARCHERGRAEPLGARDRGRHAARFEGRGRVLRFVLDQQLRPLVQFQHTLQPRRMEQRRVRPHRARRALPSRIDGKRFAIAPHRERPRGDGCAGERHGRIAHQERGAVVRTRRSELLGLEAVGRVERAFQGDWEASALGDVS